MRLNAISDNRVDDRLLVGRLLEEDPKAAGEFFARMKDTIWTVCTLAALDDQEARRSYMAVKAALQADGFARLRPFQRGRLDQYVALSVREILIDLAMKTSDQSIDRRWRHFERLFKKQITGIILQVCPDRAGRSEAARADNAESDQNDPASHIGGPAPGGEKQPVQRLATLSFKQLDLYQRVAIALSKDDCKVLRSYVKEGTLSRSLRRMVCNALFDQRREDTWRPTLPNAVERLSPLEQLVFKAIYWERQDSDPRKLLSVIATRAEPGLTADAISAALPHVRAAVGPAYSVRRIVPEEDGDVELDDPEILSSLLVMEGAIEALHAAIEDLPPREGQFARTYLEGSNQSRRDVFGSDNYKLMRQIKTKLARKLLDVPAIAAWLADIKIGEN